MLLRRLSTAIGSIVHSPPVLGRQSIGTAAMVVSETEPQSFYTLQLHTPVCQLQCGAWPSLSPSEQLYAHHVARAAWLGSIIVQHQTSAESPAIGVLLYDVFTCKRLDELRQCAMEQCHFTQSDWMALLLYNAGFWANNGNYKSFGDTKFIPGVEIGKVDTLVHTCCSDTKDTVALWDQIKDRIYSLKGDQRLIGYGGTGTNAYLSSDVTPEDAQVANNFMSHHGLEAWNTRLFKTSCSGKTQLEIRLASLHKGEVRPPEEFQGAIVCVTRGDYSGLLEYVVQHLQLAIPHAANDRQKQMIAKYVEYFATGDLKAHMDGSRLWIKDIAPSVESYIGFIENYVDPAGVRACFEGFVAAVDHQMSRKFADLVANAETFLDRLPWARSGYEKDKFLQPDFTALDVVAFASNGVPKGINIPNYDEIRQVEGFKNVSLGNVLSAMPDVRTSFVSDSDDALYRKYFKRAFEVQVGLHELLGHGSGKLFVRRRDGTFNFDKGSQKDLVTGRPVDSWYEEGETYNGRFGQLGSAYEECRAEAVGYFLCTCPDVLRVFNIEGDEGETIAYVNWMAEMRAGLVALEMYDADKCRWGQAHSWARHVLLRVCLDAGGGFVRVDETVGSDGRADLLITVDRHKIEAVGRPAIAHFLKLLQSYKSCGDGVGGAKLFNAYAPSDDYWLRVRHIVVERRQPRGLLVQPNTVLTHGNGDGGAVSLCEYEPSVEGAAQSVIERFAAPNDWRDRSLYIWNENKHHFGM